ncbi:hypothetical protein AOC05_02460 [Arthrobacter alpinus]|uniref:Uncharacterized protein n=1 Tax=Arthrobacter alpinus TaxID=656366 RepID=A0A0M4QNI0_9MICC|nr:MULTISPECIES: hypothetical protein [Arthrobacter]ALE91478.1 hypothetical protein AOC05_02460 [Arthrobacter alpinus]
MHTLILIATTTPPSPPLPTLRPGLSEDQITPGLLGFVITFSIVVVMFFLIRDMTKRVRRVRYRAQVEEGLVGGSHGPGAEYMGIPIMSEEATRAAAYSTNEDDDGEDGPGTDTGAPAGTVKKN